jgi:cell wall-associated NlpC family hydrolase
MVFDTRLTPARPDLASAQFEGKIPSARYVTGVPHHIRVPVTSVYRMPSETSPRETQAIWGESLTVFEDVEGWAWVQLARDGYVGYVRSADVSLHLKEPTHFVRTKGTFLYDKASIKTPNALLLPQGAHVQVVRQDGDFSVTDAGAYLWTAHLQSVEHRSYLTPAMINDAVSIAESWQGAPYLWGGKTHLGCDCSGLIQCAFAHVGWHIPRDSDQQQAIADLHPVNPASAPLTRGDLVFWKGHVGILRDASTLLHANGHHMQVVSEPLDDAVKRIRLSQGGEPAFLRYKC